MSLKQREAIKKEKATKVSPIQKKKENLHQHKYKIEKTLLQIN